MAPAFSHGGALRPSRNMSTPLGPVVARPVVMGCVTGGFAVR